MAASVDSCGGHPMPNFSSYHRWTRAWLRIWTGAGDTEHRVPGLDDRVLGGPGQVGGVEVGQVVVEEPARAAGERCHARGVQGRPDAQHRVVRDQPPGPPATPVARQPIRVRIVAAVSSEPRRCGSTGRYARSRRPSSRAWRGTTSRSGSAWPCARRTSARPCSRTNRAWSTSPGTAAARREASRPKATTGSPTSFRWTAWSVCSGARARASSASWSTPARPSCWPGACRKSFPTRSGCGSRSGTARRSGSASVSTRRCRPGGRLRTRSNSAWAR